MRHPLNKRVKIFNNHIYTHNFSSLFKKIISIHRFLLRKKGELKLLHEFFYARVILSIKLKN